MSKKRPVIGIIKSAKRPILTADVKDQLNWSFSFKYYGQREFFGLGEVATKWYVSLLERLRDLSRLSIDSFFKDYGVKEDNRFHPINWDAKEIPIQKHEIDWVDKTILANDVEYPFFQFQLSTGTGRIVGFWNENHTLFNVVLLDPMHNLQPSADYNYRVDTTTVEYSQLTSILMDIDKLRGAECLVNGCNCKEELHKIPTKLYTGNLVYFHLDTDYYEAFMKETKNKSITEIIKLGLLSC